MDQVAPPALGQRGRGGVVVSGVVARCSQLVERRMAPASPLTRLGSRSRRVRVGRILS